MWDQHSLNIIALAPNHWDHEWKNRQHLLSRLGARHRIVYSTGPWSVWDRNGEPWRRARWRGSFTAQDNVLLDSPAKGLLRWPKLGWYDRTMLALHGARLRRLPAFAADRPLALLLFHPAFAPYIDILRPDIVAYHAYDLFERTPGWSPALAEQEHRLLRRAAFVSTITEAARRRLEEKSGRAVHLLPNGVDLELFAPARFENAPLPVELRAIPHPRIGFAGNLRPTKVDYGLLTRLAKATPGWQFVLIGGNFGTAADPWHDELRACRRCPNVHFLPTKPHPLMPAYLYHMDVNILPYRVNANTWVDTGHPLKLYEYLAVGKPVVGCDLEALREHSNLLAIARTEDEWATGIERALTGQGVSNTAARRQAARGNSWQHRVDALEAWLLAAVPQSGQRPRIDSAIDPAVSIKTVGRH